MIIANDDRGTGLVEYALLVMVIALTSLAAVSTFGESTSDTFDEVAAGFDGTTTQTETEPELTPDEKWELAKDEYTKAIEEAKATKSAELEAAKADYDSAKKQNSALPKAEKKAANKEAKENFNQAKKDANSTYKASVNEAKSNKAAAKKEWQSSK